MLKQRVITALILAPLAIIGVFFLGLIPFAFFIGAIITLAAWEWAGMAGLAEQPARVGYSAAMAVLLYLCWHLPWHWVLGVGVLWWIFAWTWVRSYPDSAASWGSVPICLLMGVLVLVPAWVAFMTLKTMPQPDWMILYLFACVWGADTGAYFSGRAFGKKKLSPSVSPNKSWEGVYGGLAVTGLMAVGVSLYREFSLMYLILAVVVTLLTVMFSVHGDLVESMVKRHRGIKDSSNLLPGHGGVMDRIDSLTAAAPVFAFLLMLFGVNSL